MRGRAKELVGDHIVAESAPFSFSLKEGGEEIRTAPFVYVASLWVKVLSMLDQNEKYITVINHYNQTFTCNIYRQKWLSLLA